MSYFIRAACLSALIVLALGVILPSSAAAVSAPATGEATLPDLDTRKLSAAPSQARALDKLEDSLGPLGFADPGGALGGAGFVGSTGGYLTGPSNAAAAQVVLGYVADHAKAFGLDGGDLADLELSRAYTSDFDGVRHLTFEQMVDGVPSFDTRLTANVTGKGQLINVSGSPAGDLELDDPDPELSAKEALFAARENVGGSDAGAFGPLESARLVAFAKPGGDAELAYAVYADSLDSLLYEVVVGADSGEVLLRQSRTDFLDQARVWNGHPDQTQAPLVVNLAADPAWLDDSAGRTRLKGNNAHAYADIGAPDGVNAGEDIASVGNDWNFPMSFFNQAECPAFGCTWDNTIGGSSATNRSAEVTDLFYLTNRYHDYLLTPPIGFDEASGNFERVNSSGMGLGNDHVLAEGEDSSSTNNANFATPPDGSPPRMQMFLWNADWDVAGDGSADVVYHEYGHGLTNRLMGPGGLSANQSGAMGEAWGDWYANDFLVATGEKTDGVAKDLFLGEYVIQNFLTVPGIRRQAMDCNPGDVDAFCPAHGTTGAGGFTFGDLGKFNGANSVHDNGEIWAQTLWDLRERLGSFNSRAVVTGGLRLAPPTPTFLQMRDAILQSAPTVGVARRPIWEVFAARGMGFSASTPSAAVFSGTEAFDIPARLEQVSRTITDPAPLGDADGVPEPGETVEVLDELTNPVEEATANVVGKIATTAPGIFVGTDEVSFPNFPAVATTAASSEPYTITIPASATCGDPVPLETDVSFTGGTVALDDTSVVTGAPSFQTENPAAPIPDNNVAGVDVPMNLPAGTVNGMVVRIDSLTHTFDGDLRLKLTSPSATTVALMTNRGGSGDNLTNLVFDDAAATPVSAGVAPFTGSFRPEQPLSAFDGEPQAGVWTLNVADTVGADTGTINNWSLASGRDCSTAVPALPVATTTPATAIATKSATLGGTVDSNGTATSFAFEYGTTTDYGSMTPSSASGAGPSPVARTAAVAGLAPNTTYHYRTVALRNGTKVAAGQNRTFKTLTAPIVNDDCEKAKAALAAAQSDAAAALKRKKKLKKKVKKAKKSGNKKKIKKAKKKYKKAKTKLKAARAAVAEAEAAVAAAC